MKMIENDGNWQFVFSSSRLEMIQLDFRLGLLLLDENDDCWVFIEQECVLSAEDRSISIVPEITSSTAPVLSLLRTQATGITITRTGRLTISFVNGNTLTVNFHESYEAWQLNCTIGNETSMFVCSPGGRVSKYAMAPAQGPKRGARE
jgi:hypothetical protein